jgi:hypothetical protein
VRSQLTARVELGMERAVKQLSSLIHILHLVSVYYLTVLMHEMRRKIDINFDEAQG